jgi:hypothetical protein
MENGKWKLENGKWKMENGKWKLEIGKWIMDNGKWKMDNGIPVTNTQCQYYGCTYEYALSQFISIAIGILVLSRLSHTSLKNKTIHLYKYTYVQRKYIILDNFFLIYTLICIFDTICC